MEMRDFKEKIGKDESDIKQMIGARTKLAEESGYFREEQNFKAAESKLGVDLITAKISLADDFRQNQNIASDFFNSIVKESKRIQGIEKR